jgi:hypothetical protein
MPQAEENRPAATPAADDSLGESDDNESSKDDEDSESDSSAGPTPAESTQSGRKITRPTRLIKESGATMPDLENYEIQLMRAEETYYEAMKVLHEGEFIPDEVNCVGAGIEVGFISNTKELHVMK